MHVFKVINVYNKAVLSVGGGGGGKLEMKGVGTLTKNEMSGKWI